MSVPRRTRLSVIAAAASGALVVAMAGTAMAADRPERPSCSDLDLQDAQAALDEVVPAERLRLDDLCESVTTLRSDDEAAPDTTPAAAPDDESADEEDDPGDADEDAGDANSDEGRSAARDRDCADFGSQADAQAALEEDPDDPERIDADDDGIACENHFGTEDQQVAVYPQGGVATGGAPTS